MHDRLKIKKQLLENEKISYATDVIELPEGGIDCGEGCNPYGFPPECADVVKNFDTLQKAVDLLRGLNNGWAAEGGNVNRRIVYTLTLYKSDDLVLTAPTDEYTITLAEGVEARVTTDVDNAIVKTTGTTPTFTYKVYVTHNISYVMTEGAVNPNAEKTTFTTSEGSITLW